VSVTAVRIKVYLFVRHKRVYAVSDVMYERPMSQYSWKLLVQL